MVATATESGFYRSIVTFDEKVEEPIPWTKDKDASLVTLNIDGPHIHPFYKNAYSLLETTQTNISNTPTTLVIDHDWHSSHNWLHHI
jgi:hypothetical protein